MMVFALAFLVGRGIGSIVQKDAEQYAQDETEKIGGAALEATTNANVVEDLQPTGSKISAALESWPFSLNTPMQPGTENWGLGFGDAGSTPTGNASVEELKKYNAYYVGASDSNKIYLTFDCGYENGNTEAILDALKKHNAQATFFVVGHYLESAPEIVQRMVEEGHLVGNHTYHHPDMSKVAETTAFRKEMDSVREKYREVTGEEMPMFYRPPQGKYNIENLQMAKDLGYSTFFWSLAYVDWNPKSQPTHEEAFSKLISRIHPGAIVLLHNTSQTNAEILDELLTKWEEKGYTFGSLKELAGE